jgi:hypothetical protein
MKRRLLWWVSSGNGHVVIAPVERVAQFDAIHRASTWGEFAQADPATYRSMCDSWEEEGEGPPLADDSFDISMGPGYEQGDYPPWLQSEMDLYVPMDILHAHARSESSILNGRFWILEPEDMPAVIDKLRARGIEIEPTDERPYI